LPVFFLEISEKEGEKYLLEGERINFLGKKSPRGSRRIFMRYDGLRSEGELDLGGGS